MINIIWNPSLQPIFTDTIAQYKKSLPLSIKPESLECLLGTLAKVKKLEVEQLWLIYMLSCFRKSFMGSTLEGKAGLHSLLIIGWREDATRRLYHVQNSWGPTWGDKRFLLCSTRYNSTLVFRKRSKDGSGNEILYCWWLMLFYSWSQLKLSFAAGRPISFNEKWCSRWVGEGGGIEAPIPKTKGTCSILEHFIFFGSKKYWCAISFPIFFVFFLFFVRSTSVE